MRKIKAKWYDFWYDFLKFAERRRGHPCTIFDIFWEKIYHFSVYMFNTGGWIL